MWQVENIYHVMNEKPKLKRIVLNCGLMTIQVIRQYSKSNRRLSINVNLIHESLVKIQ